MSLGDVGVHTKGSCTQEKTHFLVMENYVKDVKQGRKIVLDLVESIMRPTDLVKGEVRRKQ